MSLANVWLSRVNFHVQTPIQGLEEGWFSFLKAKYLTGPLVDLMMIVLFNVEAVAGSLKFLKRKCSSSRFKFACLSQSLLGRIQDIEDWFSIIEIQNLKVLIYRTVWLQPRIGPGEDLILIEFYPTWRLPVCPCEVP